MEKRLTIKEFSELAGIKTSTLRYWDTIGLFSPSIRDPENNYRYYAPGQVLSVNFFTVLSSLNVPLKQIKSADEDRNPESIIKLIEQQEKILDGEMKRLHECYSIIHTRREMINAGMKAKPNEVRVEELGESAFVLGPVNETKNGEGPFECFTNFCNQAEKLHINLNFPVCGYYNKMENFLHNSLVPDRFASLDPNGKHIRKAGKYMLGFYQGGFGEFGNLQQKMLTCAQENGLTLVGQVYTQYLLDEICVKDSSRYLAQICVAVN